MCSVQWGKGSALFLEVEGEGEVEWLGRMRGSGEVQFIDNMERDLIGSNGVGVDLEESRVERVVSCVQTKS
jgi:hypothetical protein